MIRSFHRNSYSAKQSSFPRQIMCYRHGMDCFCHAYHHISLLLPRFILKGRRHHHHHKKKTKKRKRKRKSSDFNITTKLNSQKQKTQDAVLFILVSVSIQTDLHLDCNKWDEVLRSGFLEPQEIVEKLPAFLMSVMGVQGLIRSHQEANHER